MDQQSLTTPSITPSKDPMTKSSSHEPSSPIAISLCSSDSDEFKPHQMLMQTPITIECGQDLSIKLTVHEELLCCHSRLLEDRFAEAKALRQQYDDANSLRSLIAAHVFPEVTEDDFKRLKHEGKALPLIISAYEEYPLSSYRKIVRQCIAEATEEQVKLKNVKNRMLQHAIREANWKARIAYIDSCGIHAITASLFSVLHKISKKEIARAEEDLVRAAAQKRILVPGVEKTMIQLVIQWVYEGKLECQDPQQLYDTLQLATQLGIEALSELCLTRVCNAAHDSMHRAMITGTTLKSLLGCGPDPSENVIGIIFKHALQDHGTPKRIQELVVNALATSLDTELWQKLRGTVNHDMALHIIDSMLEHRQQVMEGSHDYDVIKFEDEHVHTPSPIYHQDE